MKNVLVRYRRALLVYSVYCRAHDWARVLTRCRFPSPSHGLAMTIEGAVRISLLRPLCARRGWRTGRGRPRADRGRRRYLRG